MNIRRSILKRRMHQYRRGRDINLAGKELKEASKKTFIQNKILGIAADLLSKDKAAGKDAVNAFSDMVDYYL